MRQLKKSVIYSGSVGQWAGRTSPKCVWTLLAVSEKPRFHPRCFYITNILVGKYPTVAEKLASGIWTKEAEKELLKVATA